ncbi:protein BIG GRAIN 1-like protein E [Cinnamomum micranthum f. kanehirae]|uniref:Protein BIG GRAIN 1-like protein E n=1 Tax=Cinnamomum micranthum f. kanehirae TaxID=337451 RepID=A0A3S3MIQ2_9MAGN|nr:protein BIG GRAIN 1-like protein E [Cinnamomum micranthum f. kanehirae]
MATTDPAKRQTKKPTHRRNDSGELDVFEAARYFSGGADSAHFVTSVGVQRGVKEEQRPAWGGGRKSLDVHMQTPLPSESQGVLKSAKEKKSRQPSSPGSRLASFLNSLFSQTSSKKKSKSKSQSVKDDEESPGGRRKRRSSISHVQGIGSRTDSNKSIYSSSNSGFRTPPAYSHTPTKIYKDPFVTSDQKRIGSLSAPKQENGGLVEKKNLGSVCLDDTFKFSDEFPEKKKIFGNGVLDKDRTTIWNGLLEKDRSWVEGFSIKEKDLRRIGEVDDGFESDSSSDLFELQNYDLGLYSSGLPVYETTHMERINRGAPIANAT